MDLVFSLFILWFFSRDKDQSELISRDTGTASKMDRHVGTRSCKTRESDTAIRSSNASHFWPGGILKPACSNGFQMTDPLQCLLISIGVPPIKNKQEKGYVHTGFQQRISRGWNDSRPGMELERCGNCESPFKHHSKSIIYCLMMMLFLIFLEFNINQ